MSVTKKVFISYNSKDRDLAILIHNYLNERNISNWFAEGGDIPAGAYYTTEIHLSIKNCDIFLLLASENSIGNIKKGIEGSPEVAKEIQLASNERRYIIPLKLDNSLDAGIYHLATVNWVDLVDKDIQEQALIACQTVENRLQEGIPQIDTFIQRSALNEQAQNITKIEQALKANDTLTAIHLLQNYRYAKEYDQEILLLKIMTSMIKNNIRNLQSLSVNKLLEQLQSLKNSSYYNIALYLMAILSVSYFKENCIFDQTGGYKNLHTQSKQFPKIPAKYILMTRNINCINIELQWNR